MKLSVCMIVRNEERHLESLLCQVVRFADELVILDTGSTDRTKDIAQKYTSRVYDHVWKNDFSEARNASYSYATGDYLMNIDADHILDDTAVEKLISLKSALGEVKTVYVMIQSPDTLGVPVASNRITKRDGDPCLFRGAVHERYPETEPRMMTDIVIRHRDKKKENGPVCFSQMIYRDYIRKLSDREIREHFWLGVQCYVDLTLAGERKEAEDKLSLVLGLDTTVTEMLRCFLIAGNIFMYWGVYDEALKMYELFLHEAGKRDESMPVCPYLLSLLLKAQKCSYMTGDIKRSAQINDLALSFFPDSIAAISNRLWFERFSPVTLSVCMIVRDEEAVLERCLRNAVRFADELIIVDTGSADSTRDIALRYTDKVFDYKWQDDFAAARNYSYGKASCDYIMWLDADDDLEEEDIEKLLYLKRNMPPKTDVVQFDYIEDSKGRPVPEYEVLRDRLIRRELDPVWRYPVHEAIRMEQGWNILKRPDIRIFHRKVRANEKRRNISIFEKKLAEGFELNCFNRAYLVRELTTDGRFEEAVTEFKKLWDEGEEQPVNYALVCYIYLMMRLRRFSELKEMLEKYINRFGPDEKVMCVLGDIYRKEGDNDTAVKWYMMTLAFKVDLCDDKIHQPVYYRFRPLLGMGEAYLEKGDPVRAKEAFAGAREIDPSDMELKILMLKLELSEKHKEDEK